MKKFSNQLKKCNSYQLANVLTQEQLKVSGLQLTVAEVLLLEGEPDGNFAEPEKLIGLNSWKQK